MRKNITRICIALTVCISAMAFAQTPEREESDFERQQAARKYFNDLRTSGEEKDLAKINENAYKAFKNVGNIVAFKGLTIPAWQPIGGHQLDNNANYNAGRSKSIAFGGTDIAYVAFAGGGIWKTTNINASEPAWVCLTDKMPSICYGAVATDPRNSDVVYAGTGEYISDRYKNPSNSGVYKSIDGGLNWFTILGKDTSGPSTSQIVLDPKNPDIVYIALGTARTTSGIPGGVVRSTNGGQTWTLSTLTGNAPSCLIIDPNETNRLYAGTYTDGGGNGKIWRSTDGGMTWTQTKTGLPASGLGRISLSLSPSSPNTIYASIGQQQGDSTYGLWVSTDNGDSWRNFVLKPRPGWCGAQASYDNSIAVHPTLTRQVYLGGLEIWRTGDSGKTFNKITNSQGGGAYAHADVQWMTFNGSTLYANTDGGLAVGKNFGSSWSTDANKGISTLEFVGADADPAFTYVIGGCQDNGTNYSPVNRDFWAETRGGDGGRTFIARDNPSLAFSTYVYGTLYKSFSGGKDGDWQKLTTPFENKAPFYINYDFDASASTGIVGGSLGLYVTTGGGENWNDPPITTIKSASACHVLPDDGTYMWAGVTGSVYRTIDQGTTWTKTAISGTGAITGIISDPSNNQNLWICSQGQGGTNKHVYKSTDGGATYTGLPNFPTDLGCNAIARQQINGKDRIIVGTDKGVLYTENDGQTWNALADGMPMLIVTSLKIKGVNNNKLLASTYGRGCMWLDLSQLTSVKSVDAPLSYSPFELLPITPNPISGEKATLGLTLSKPAVVTVTLFDILGKEVKVLEKKMMEIDKSSVDFSTQGLSSGSYVVVATSNGISKTQKIIIE